MVVIVQKAHRHQEVRELFISPIMIILINITHYAVITGNGHKTAQVKLCSVKHVLDWGNIIKLDGS